MISLPKNKNILSWTWVEDSTVYPDRVWSKEMLEDNNVNNNALQNDLRNCIEWFNMVEQSWSLKSFEEGKLYICSQTCGKCKSDVS